MRGTSANPPSAGISNTWADPVLGTYSRLNVLNTTSHYVPLSTTVNYTENVDVGGGTLVPTSVIKWKDSGGSTINVNDIVGVHIILPEGFTGNIDAMGLRWDNTETSILNSLGSNS